MFTYLVKFHEAGIYYKSYLVDACSAYAAVTEAKKKNHYEGTLTDVYLIEHMVGKTHE